MKTTLKNLATGTKFTKENSDKVYIVTYGFDAYVNRSVFYKMVGKGAKGAILEAPNRIITKYGKVRNESRNPALEEVIPC